MVLLLMASLAGQGCGEDARGPFDPTEPVRPRPEPARVVVQHILIGFVGSIPGKSIVRTREEARDLAGTLLAEARHGADFDALVARWTDDAAPGIYGMVNLGVAPNPAADPREYPRGHMVPAFGDVGFAISPGNIAMAAYDARESPYGWHIIKRLR